MKLHFSSDLFLSILKSLSKNDIIKLSKANCEYRLLKTGR